MDSIGERFRRERLRQGFDLQQIAEITKINIVLLEAIEADDLEKLPGIFFTRSFVRQYARALGLEEADFESELDRLAGCEQVPTLEDRPTSREDFEVAPVAAAGRPSGLPHALAALAAFLLIMAACSAVYVLWERARQSKDMASNPAVSEAASQPSRAQPPPATAAATDQAKPSANPPVEPPAAAPVPVSEPAPGEPTTEAAPADGAQAPAPGQPATEAAPPQPPAVLATVAPGQPAPVQVQIRATRAVWIRVAADGKYLFSATLHPNEVRSVEANQLVQVRAGNAAGVEILWNGKPVGAIGPEGQARNVELTPAGFKILAPLPAKPATPDDGL